MIRIASVFTSHTATLVRPAAPVPAPQTPLIPPVSATPAHAPQAADHDAAKSEATFALILSRTTGDVPPVMPLFADPLPDLPTLDLPAP